MTTARPYVTPVRLGHLAGRTFTPRRRTPMHAWHEARGAAWLLAGNWMRPEYYPVVGRTREQCIEAEASSVRTNVGLIDLGTLGKLEVNGTDAVAFLGNLYTGRFAKLKVGMARYGVACDESGVLIDDGIVGRLAENRFYVSTTTSGSDAIYRKMLWWLVQWSLDVQLANATSAYGAMNLAGPSSRRVLQPLVEIPLDEESFPYLGMRECTVAGVPSRVSRVGFVGELGYEIHPRTDGALHVWDALMKAGEPFGIQPFGVEAQRLLRLEKGHIILGQDSDGLTNPYEAACGWAVRMKKPFFVGKRSLEILEAQGLKRNLVGFVLDKDYSGPVPRECHLVVDGPAILGRVTSAKYSPALGQVVGLAYVPPARAEVGSTLSIKIDRGELIRGTVVKLPFYDPEGRRQQPDTAMEGQ
jgi:sarcosine oxidase subunit alpha